MRSNKQNKDARLLSCIAWIGIFIIVLITVLTSCSNRVHVITEQDGGRVINWYSK